MWSGKEWHSAVGGAGGTRGLPEDGGSPRDLRAVVDSSDEDAQLTGLLPPPSVLTLARMRVPDSKMGFGRGEGLNV